MIIQGQQIGQTYDTATMSVWHLVGLLKQLKRGPWFWQRENGDPVLFVRAVRARFFRDRLTMTTALRAIMNTLDPPQCRCGRPGTRIIGGTTHCDRCGPGRGAAHRRGWAAAQHEKIQTAISARLDEEDQVNRKKERRQRQVGALRKRRE